MFFNSTRLTRIPQGSVASSRVRRMRVLMTSREVKVSSNSRSPIIFLRVVADRFSIPKMGFSIP